MKNIKYHKKLQVNNCVNQNPNYISRSYKLFYLMNIYLFAEILITDINTDNININKYVSASTDSNYSKNDIMEIIVPSKVILDKEGGVELADGDLVGIPGGWHHLIQEFRRRPFPDFLDDCSKFCVALVNDS